MQINTLRLRAMLGWLAMLLPWIVVFLAMCSGYSFPASISMTYYYASCITPFMIILGSASILLIAYKGYDKLDDIICTIAGIFGLGICLFPCSNYALLKAGLVVDKVGTFQLPYQISSTIHNVTAIVFFGLLAFNSFFLFTKGDDNPTKRKKIRNFIYRLCGLGMIGSFALLIPLYKNNIHAATWIVETIALAFFGLSWLTKADIYPWLFADSPYEE